MKISTMLQRENFCEILEHTLEYYYAQADESEVKMRKNNLYIYPVLNAVISQTPGRGVCQYLQQEYKVRNNIVKCCLAQGFVFASLHTGGMLALRLMQDL